MVCGSPWWFQRYVVSGIFRQGDWKMSKMKKFGGENKTCAMILFVRFGPSLCLKNIRQGIPCLGRVYPA